jgi:hypothetical protein
VTTWNLTELRSRVRALTGRSEEADLSTDDLDNYINDFYRQDFPEEIESPEFDNWFTVDTQADKEGGDGTYPVGDDYLKITYPFTIDGYPISYYTDPSEFFGIWPATQTYTSMRPTHVLHYGNELTFMPPPDDVYEFKARTKKRPTALSDGSDEIVDAKWGPAIAYGTAIKIMNEAGDDVSHLVPVFDIYMVAAGRKRLSMMGTTRAVPRF